jgi:N-glycosylase/DNA lyase
MAPAETGAILWILAHFAYFRTQHHNQTTSLDYADFLRRARCKVHQMQQKHKRIGNYLSVL